MNHKLISLIAHAIAKIVDYKIIPIDLFRNLDFRGKLTIGSCLNDKSFPSSGIFNCREILFDIDFNDQLEKFIYLNLYERQELKLIRQIINPGACCIDVGANVGFYSLNMAQRVGKSGRVFAFEPDPSNFAKLTHNIQINGYDNIISALSIGLSSSAGKAIFSRTPASNSGWGRIGDWKSASEKIEIEIMTLDDFLIQNNIKSIDLLKCDIEGHEFEFLRGASKSLENGLIKHILIEYCGYVLDKQGYSVSDYLSLFANYGYYPSLLNLDRLHQKDNKNITYNLLFQKKK